MPFVAVASVLGTCERHPGNADYERFVLTDNQGYLKMVLHDLPQIKPGPVEAIHAKFEKELHKNGKIPSILDHHYDTYLFASSQLPGPDNTTGPGFQDTAEWLLGDRIPNKAISLIQEANWSLYQLLNATNENLQKIGIAFESDRMKVLAAVRAFHLAPWRTLQTISLKPEGGNKKYKVHIVFLLETFSRLTQQLYIDAATIAWLRQRIPRKNSERERLKIILKEAIEANKVLLSLTEGIHQYTVRLNKNIPHHPIDYIGPVDKKSRPLYKRIILSSVLLVSICLLSPIIEAKLSQTALRPLNKLPLKWCLLVGWLCV